MSARGRRAVLPAAGARSARGLLESQDDVLVVRCFAQDGGEHRDFDFGVMAVDAELRREMAAAFARRTATGAGLTALVSMAGIFRSAGHFADWLAGLAWPPKRVAELMPEHIDGFQEHRAAQVSTIDETMRDIKSMLLHAHGLHEAMEARLRQPNPKKPKVKKSKQSYSRAEFRRIAEAARTDLHTAAARIRRNRADLERYRAGHLVEPGRRLELLDFIDRHGDVPRRITNWSTHSGREAVQPWVVKFGPAADTMAWLHLSAREAAAAAVLLAVLTGENPSVVLKVRVAHHRADGHTGATATAIVDTKKPRRGRRAYMSMVLSEVPDWISIPADPDHLSARDELHTPFGAYALINELTAGSRKITGSDRLLIGWRAKGGGDGPAGRRGLRPESGVGITNWSRAHGLKADAPDADGNPVELRVTLDLIRLTWLELHQKPVAHTEQTLVNNYLGRNRGNLAEYQKVVAAALAGEVDKARVRGVMARLTVAD
ncbi:MAG: hypothetical protein ACJ8F7_20580, partial [Gemmataceae bacterium]